MFSRLTIMRSLCATAVLGVGVLRASVAPGALNAYLTLTGQKQGKITGPSKEKGREGTSIVTGVSHSTLSPRDAASGLPSGKRPAPPVGEIVVTKVSDLTSSSLFRKAITAQEVMSTAVFDGPNVWGNDPNDRVTATLENAMIDSCVPATPPPPGQSETCTISYSAVSLVHQATPGKAPERLLK